MCKKTILPKPNNLKKQEVYEAIERHRVTAPGPISDETYKRLEEHAHEEARRKQDIVDHPPRYNQYSVEVIDMMEMIYGKEAMALWCEMTAFKYRQRMGLKPGVTIGNDLEKEKWYLKRRLEVLERIEKEKVKGEPDGE